MASSMQVRGRWDRLFSTMPSKFWNHGLPWPWYPRSLLGNMDRSLRRSIPRAVYSHLPGTCVWNAMGLLCSLPHLVLEHGIQWFWNGKGNLGALSFRRLVAQPKPPTPSSSSKAALVEASRGPDSDPPQRAIMGDTPSALRSSDVVVLGNEELVLPGFSRAPLLPPD
jgi:hypothetical protein